MSSTQVAPIPDRNTVGFSMIEVVLAGVVLSIAFVGLSSTMVQGHVITADTRDEHIARRAIRSKMAEIRATEFTSVGKNFHNTKSNVDGLQGVPRNTGGYKKPLSVTVESGPTDGLLRITLTNTWRTEGRTKSVLRYV